MRVRHKVPSLFSLSMVDVLCCALGCVILLWLLGAKQSQDDSVARDAETQGLRLEVESERERSRRLLAGSRDENSRLDARVRQLLGEREKAVALEARLAERIRTLESVRDGLRTDLAGQRLRAGQMEAKLKESQARVSGLEADVKSGAARLDSERKRAGGLDRKLSDAEAALKGMRADLDRARALHDKERRNAEEMRKTIEARQRELATLNRSLEDAKAARTKLETSLAARGKEMDAASRSYKDRLEAAEERERFLAKQLKDRHDAVETARTALATLQRRTLALEADAKGRFAGIELTGKRVVFLVDISGSMELLDESTRAPHKWLEVRNTVARLMRSLPDLEKFQVITFNNKADFPLGSDGKWLSHEGEASTKRVLATLAKVKVKGGTNMYAALNAAFRYRKDGLDAVYLLSDGLPNQGEGLTAAHNNLNEFERGLILGRYIRARLKADWNKVTTGKPRVKINTIGFFYESPDLGAFLWALARENDGSFVGMSRP
jgi:hypothetical protein